jgi:hypothetical protein
VPLPVSDGYNVVIGLVSRHVGFSGVAYTKDLGHNVPAVLASLKSYIAKYRKLYR